MNLSAISGISRVAILSIFLSACGGGGNEQAGDLPEDLPPPPQIAGIWSGTWEGIDTDFGPAAGTWEARISQQETEIKGPIIFGGDIDCAEGSMTGTADAETEVVSGQVVRNPCPSNDWLFTAFNQEENSASGTWEKAFLSNGSFEGQRIATFTGPVISYVYPPAGRVGAYLTIVGERLAMDAATDSLMLGENGAALVPLTTSDKLIRVQLPGNISTPGQLVLTTARGKALSPRYFNTEPTNPNTVITQNIPLDTSNAIPTGISFSVNGRRAFVTNPNDGSVIMINTEMGKEWTSTVVLPVPSPALPPGPLPITPVHAVTVNPNGRHIYVAGHNHVFVVHAHTLELIRTITVLADNGPLLGDLNPHGIAISPDGRWLLLSQALDGGRVTILDLENDFSIFDTLEMDAGNFPRGIAVSPDNTHAYIAVSGIDNEIWVYNLESAALEPTLVMGNSPAAIAVTADAKRIYVINTLANTVNYLDRSTGFSGEVDLGFGVAPTGIAITPDDLKAYVAGSLGSIHVIDILSNQVVPIDVGGGSTAIAISPDGKRAYVTLAASNKVVEIGNQRSLRISKQGGGIGDIKTFPDGINCGTTCIASFDDGAEIELIATPDDGSNSRFNRWSGDADCSDGRVVMNANRFCVANFTVFVPTSSSSSGSGSSDCFIATAAYGSWLDPHVLILREFRDRHLLTNEPGTRFVEFYYHYSPPIANYIRERETLRAIVRSGLGLIIYSIEYPVAAGFALFLLLLIMIRQSRGTKGAELE
jgi:DNA-binding beta-propeller fold protein YncE